jgi:signal transduction histidine kinase
VRLNSLLRSWSFRLALGYASLFVASIMIAFGVTYWRATQYSAQDETDEIGVELLAIQDEIKLAGQGRLPIIVENHSRRRKDVRAVYLLEDATGQKLAGNIDARPPSVGAAMIRVMFDGKELDVRSHTYRLSTGEYLLIGQDTSTLRAMEHVIVRAFGTGLGATLLLALAGAILFGRIVLHRVETVGVTARAIAGGDLSSRVPLRGTDDEFDGLGKSVNAMLDRIEALIDGLRRVTTDIAHDLRTPLGRLRQRLERAHASGATTDELRDAIARSIIHVDNILETFGALLHIAQLESAAGTRPPQAVDLSHLLAGIVDDFSPAAEDEGQNLTARIPEGLTLSGDPELIAQMMANLVDNAIRHCPRGTSIHIGARSDADAVVVTVSDNGLGIPQDERDKVLRPFYRLEASRATKGNGLGLSMVAAIAKWHHAHVELGDSSPGLRVTIKFRKRATVQ